MVADPQKVCRRIVIASSKSDPRRRFPEWELSGEGLFVVEQKALVTASGRQRVLDIGLISSDEPGIEIDFPEHARPPPRSNGTFSFPGSTPIVRVNSNASERPSTIFSNSSLGIFNGAPINNTTEKSGRVTNRREGERTWERDQSRG